MLISCLAVKIGMRSCRDQRKPVLQKNYHGLPPKYGEEEMCLLDCGCWDGKTRTGRDYGTFLRSFRWRG
ncbi:hypothetical protein EJB05_22769, partial [Eragrostis curvula]